MSIYRCIAIDTFTGAAGSVAAEYWLTSRGQRGDPLSKAVGVHQPGLKVDLTVEDLATSAPACS